MDAQLYDDLVGIEGELRVLGKRAKASGDWAIVYRLAMWSGWLQGYLGGWEREHRDDPQVQMSMLAHIEGRRHDYTGDAA